MDCFNENDRRERLKELATLRLTNRPMNGMCDGEMTWCRRQQLLYEREVLILTNWERFSTEEQWFYAKRLR